MPSVTGTPQSFAFTTSGTTCTYTGGGTADSSTFDVLCVNSDNVVTQPSGWSTVASRVSSQGSYIFARNGGTTSAVLALGGGIASNTSALWLRITGAGAVDSGATNTAGVDGSAGTTTPAVTSGTLAAATELAIAFAALHSSVAALPTGFTWSSGYTGQVSGSQGIAGNGQTVAGAVAVKVPAGTAAETPSVTWTNTFLDRYILVVAFTNAAGGGGVAASGTSACAVTARATAVKSVAASARCAAVVIPRGATRKVRAATALVTAAATGRAAGVHVATATARAVVATTTGAITTKKTPATGVAALAVVAVASGSTRAATGRCVAIAAPRATASRTNAATGAMTAAVTARATTAHRIPVTATGRAVATTRAAAAKRNAVIGRAAVAMTAIGVGGQIGTTRAATGRCVIAVVCHSRIRRRTTRPNSGITVRPNAGITYRP